MKDFRIYDRNDGIDYRGWTDTAHLDANIVKTIEDNIVAGAGDKSGTSIPTAFARLYLFEQALDMVKNDQVGNSTNHELVSHYFDLMEFIFTQSNRLSFRWWDFRKEMDKLQNTNNPKHLSLKVSITKAWEGLSRAQGLPNGQTISGLHLIYLNDILIGGTSPMTLVFTSPNLVRNLQAAGIEILGTGGAKLFYDNIGVYQPRALNERDPEFREFMLQYRLLNVNLLNQKARSLDNYLTNNNNFYHPKVSIADPDFASKYPILRFEGTTISAAGLPIHAQKIDIGISDDGSFETIEINSEFIMRPTVEFYKNKTNNGQQINVQTPLVLTTGAHDLIYWRNAKWDVNFNNQLSNIRHINLWDRELPGFQQKYPFITVSDLLEDKIMEMNFNLNKDKFFTGVSANFKYLLPIRKEYFNYFTLDDLKKQLKIESNDLSGEVTVTLNIPIKGNNFSNSIEVQKKYSTSDTIKYSNMDRVFNIAIFPFYQTTEPNIDKYTILLGDITKGNLDINFYKFSNVVNNLAVTPELVKYINGQRTILPGEKSRSERRYIHLQSDNDNRFDCITITQEEVSALILPKFEKIDVNSAAFDFTFCIDFGTSNTHIAYNTNNGNVIPFDITNRDQQMIFLNQLENSIESGYGFGVYGTFRDDAKREFPPMKIEKSQPVNFPLRTAVFETVDLAAQQGDLFGNVNIAFSLKSDNNEGQNPPQRFATELKWAGVDAIQDRRIDAFCKETLWMIKNKILLNKGRLNTTIVWTRPEAMMTIMKNFFGLHWENAIKEVFGNNNQVNLVEKSESVTPYFSFVKQGGMLGAQSYMNIDIGGGTSDFIYIKPAQAGRTREAISSSIFFAANDLWGGGTENPTLQFNQNGFFRLAKEKYETPNAIALSDDIKKCFEFYLNPNINTKFTSSDVISFVFSHDSDFMFTASIQNNKNLFALIFVHYASLMYYMAQFLKKNKLPIPMNLTFTGMGSLYIRLISPRESSITDLTKILLKKFYPESELPNAFNVKFTSSPKEITATGAVYSTNAVAINEEPITHFGFEDDVEKEETFVIADIETMNLKEKVLANYNKFLDVFTTDREILRHLNQQYGLTFDANQIQRMRDMGGISFDQVYADYNDAQRLNEEIPYSMFFWTLKETLYQVSTNPQN